MSRALYRKYRSKSLDEVVGQSHITDVLKSALRKGIIAHAYLLTGPRGVGKTSVARILAHEINGLDYTDESNHLDIIEIDAASNNGVDDVRELRDKVSLAPVSASKKVYIIDEVHMLSKAAFNALLKTLEEPPEHVIFILATTDADKLPATIISRTQRYSFRLVSEADIASHLKHIAKQEKINITDEALRLIARRGQGGFRDSIGLLDQVSSLSEAKTAINEEMVASTLGLAAPQMIAELVDAADASDIKKIVSLIDSCEQAGIQVTALLDELTDEIKNRLVDQPQLVSLLDALLDVGKSPQAYLKLIAVMVAYTKPRPASRSVALAVSTPSVSASIAELEKAATKQKPHINTTNITKAPAEKPEPTEEPAPVVETKRIPAADAPAELDWQALVDYTRQNFVAIYSVLSKCGYEVVGDKLVIYAGNAFYKKKLDDAKYRANLAASLAAVCSSELIIDIIAAKQPPKDEQAAKVAAIMGGGEEVEVDI